MKLLEFRDDPQAVAAVIQAQQSRLIGLDGCDGVGKTGLAKRLVELIDGTVADLDNYLEKGLGFFVEAIRFNSLRADISSAKKPVIVVGVCLLQVLERIGVSPETLIYIELRIRGDRLEDEDLEILNAEDSLDKAPPDDLCLSDLRAEIWKYHQQYKPRRQANVVYLSSAQGS